ncbi:translocation/assembly module TamB domain-containing protein [Bacteroides sp. 224]|uniref:translocation/assembly module TamB domain-containing protein n=1 Tax=Bacteroides sp. 224 TaxID=2302936 RepID=UPI0013D7D808|nr:translocation/assembly module TamB domain-containing protein [Bacteroides sp. 224]NDV64047.1 translocation/assembly module TamB [Bacteroides sp. 224]
MAKKWIKRIALVLSIPILLFAILIILLYIPPVQNLLRKEAISYASEATGMNINVKRIDLRFPLKLLVRGVEVVQAPDTLLTLQSLSASVQVMPLFKGRIELDDITLKEASVNTVELIDGMRIDGKLGLLQLTSRGIDLSKETAFINSIKLADTHILLNLNDTTETPQDSTASALNWRVLLEELEVENVSFGMQMPADSLYLSTHLGKAFINNVEARLGEQYYGLEKLLLQESSVVYNLGEAEPLKGIDPNHLVLRDIYVEIDSVLSSGKEMKAIIKGMRMNERSGLSIASLEGRFEMDSSQICLPEFKLTTPSSEINARALVAAEVINGERGALEAALSVRLSKQDIFLFAHDFPVAFKTNFPSAPLSMQMGIEGTMDELRISRLTAELPGAFSLTGTGSAQQLTDSIARTGKVEMNMRTANLDFVRSLMVADSSIVIPHDMTLDVKAEMKGSRYEAAMRAMESAGFIQVGATFDGQTENYTASLKVDSLQINHFMPRDSIGILAITADVAGKGFDYTSSSTYAKASVNLDRLEYARYDLSGLDLTAELKNSVASAQLNSRNSLLVADVKAAYSLNKPYTEARIDANVQNLNMNELGLLTDSMSKPVSLKLQAGLMRDSIRATLTTGDLRANFRSRGSLETLMKETTAFTNELMKQVDSKELNHAALRRTLPSAALSIRSGKDNPLAEYVRITNNIRYNDINVGFVATPRLGINGRAAIHSLRVDTLQLDTVYFSTHQDTAKLRLRSGVINGPGNPHITFRSSLTGEVRSDDAELTLEFQNDKEETGVLLGVKARPAKDGMEFSFTPEEPIIAFKKFLLKDHNQVILQKDLGLIADVELLDSVGMGFRLHSIPDSVNLHNLDIEIRRIDLAEVSKILPYLPEISGLFSLEANYKQSGKNMQVSAEATIGRFFYEKTRIGNLGLGVTWLPNGNTHYLDTYLTNEGQEIMTANGTYNVASDALDLSAALEHFPLYVANAFVPVEVLELSGDIDGNVAIRGSTSRPKVEGELGMHEVEMRSHIYGVHFKLDEHPLKIANSRLAFNKYAIYSTASPDNPFIVDGYVDFSNLSASHANLTLTARNYPLLNVKRSNISELYGRVYVDLNSTLRGPLESLMMRGNLNILSSTNVTYVLKDSPLTVQDRLGDLVEFASFADDNLQVVEEESTLTSWGGLDMMMTINIDPAVKMGVELSEDRNSYVNLEGGGTLSFGYTPQGDMSLTGRYEFTGGALKYSLPVIPLKEFAVKSGSYVEWLGNPMDPNLNIVATERMRASVPTESGATQMVNFDVGLTIKNRLEDLDLAFTITAPENQDVQQELSAMDEAERGKQAVAMMVTGIYLARGGAGGSGGLDMGSAMNTLLQSSISSIAGSALKTVNISFGMDNYDDGSGSTRTDYNFRYAQRFFNDRVQVVIGGRVSTGGDEQEKDNSFIDNVSLEYRLDSSGTRYLRLFHNKNYESLLEGEVVETGAGVVLRKKVNKLGELFIFKKKK